MRMSDDLDAGRPDYWPASDSDETKILKEVLAALQDMKPIPLEPVKSDGVSAVISEDEPGQFRLKVPPQGIGICLACCGEWIQVNRDLEAGILYDGQKPVPRVPRLAITMAPALQSQQITVPGGMAIVHGYIALPSCLEHLDNREKTPAERATESGLIVG